MSTACADVSPIAVAAVEVSAGVGPAGLYAQAMGRLRPLPRGRPYLPHKYCCGARDQAPGTRTKSWLFCGSDRGGVRAAAMYSLIGTAKLNDVDPQAWLADVLARIADTPQTRLHEILPWH